MGKFSVPPMVAGGLLALLVLGLFAISVVGDRYFSTVPAGMLSEDELRSRQPIPTSSPLGYNPTAPPAGTSGKGTDVHWFGVKIPRWLPLAIFAALLLALVFGWIGFVTFAILSVLLTLLLILGKAVSPIVEFMSSLSRVARDLFGGPSGIVQRIAHYFFIPTEIVYLALLFILAVLAVLMLVFIQRGKK